MPPTSNIKETTTTGHWWEIAIPGQPGQPPKPRAVAYYRHSAQDRQENSIPIHQEQVREWAEKNGLVIVHEFADADKSGLKGKTKLRNRVTQRWHH